MPGSSVKPRSPEDAVSDLHRLLWENGDGLLACHSEGIKVHGEPTDWVTFRLLLTDSGHYLLPVDAAASAPCAEANKKAKTFIQHTIKDVKNKWRDVRHCFLCAGRAELERSEVVTPGGRDQGVLRTLKSQEPLDEQQEPLERGLEQEVLPERTRNIYTLSPEKHEEQHPDAPQFQGEPSKSPTVPREPSESPEDPTVPVEPLESPDDSKDDNHGNGTRGIFLLTRDDPRRYRTVEDEWSLFGDVLT